MSGLEHLLAQATPGPWEALDDEGIEANVVPWVGRTNEHGEIDGIADDIQPADSRLIALAPDAVRLLIDMAAALNRALGMLENDRGGDHQDRVLLARFADLDQKAGTA